ncbi:MAG: GHKL domain-containing protein [Spirochaetales bacterium]|nr:GHKL domain-containing protein [Spirochaetales bacterium]
MKQTYRIKDFIVSRTVFIAGVPFALIFFGVVAFSYASFSNAEIQRQMLLTETLASETFIHFSSATDIMETASYYIQQASLTREDQKNSLFQYLSAMMKTNPVVSALWLVHGESGTVQFNIPSVPSAVGHDMKNSPIMNGLNMTAVQDGRTVQWSGVEFNDYYKGNYFAARARVGEFLLIGWFNPTSLIGIIADQTWQKGQFGFVCDKDGQVISHPDYRFIQNRKNLMDIPAVRGAAENYKSHSFSQMKGIDEQNYLYTVVKDRNTGWLIGVAHAQKELYSFVTWLIAGGALSFLIATAIILIGSANASQHVALALNDLISGTKAIAEGRYDTVVKSMEFDEFNMLMNSVRAMQNSVQDREQKLQEINSTLETTIHTRTQELEQANRELKSTLEELSATQEKMINTEKLTALGQLAAGIAHELNTPLGATISAESVLEQYFRQDLEHCLLFTSSTDEETRNLFLSLYRSGLEKTSTTSTIIDRTVRKALQTKLKEMGISGHYRITDYLINSGLTDLPDTNPDFFLRSNHEEILKELNAVIIPLRMTTIISEAAQKSVRVVQALQNYLRQDSEEAYLSVKVEDGIESVLTLLHNKLKHGVNVVRDYEGVTVYAASHQISQVWMNIISNAAYAMDYKGTIRIATKRENNSAVIRISNDGPEIPAELQPKIFEPFFTTKKNEGMGLGLDICKRIIEKHRGTIQVMSQPENTVFTVTIPMAQEHITAKGGDTNG